MAFDPNTLYFGDCLSWMEKWDDASVDLIYLDPPFNSDAHYNVTYSTEGPEGAQTRAFADTWYWDALAVERVNRLIDAHGRPVSRVMDGLRVVLGPSGMLSYLSYMAERLDHMQRLLRPTGSIYLQCDQTASHYMKAVLDAIFGAGNFINEIIWQRNSDRGKGSQHESRTLGTDTDSIFHYSKTKGYLFNPVHKPLTSRQIAEKFPLDDDDGKGRYNTDTPIFRAPSMGKRPNLCYTYKGVTNPHPSGWRLSKERLKAMDEEGAIIWRGGVGLHYASRTLHNTAESL